MGRKRGKNSAGDARLRRRIHGCSKKVIGVAAAAVVVAALFIALAWRACGEQTENDPGDAVETEETDVPDEDASQATGATEKATLPEIEDSDSLTLSSVYTSTVLNPDGGGEYVENVASLEVTNSSELYLKAATLTGTMSDGTEAAFQIHDLPAGAMAEIFDTKNQSIDTDAVCISLICTSEEYLDADEDLLMAGSLQITASGEDAVITNIGTATLKNLTVIYHCDMAGQYFGGTSCTITIDSLAAGESYTLTDITLMGAVAVVRIFP